jgi:hypothetical protein
MTIVKTVKIAGDRKIAVYFTTGASRAGWVVSSPAGCRAPRPAPVVPSRRRSSVR